MVLFEEKKDCCGCGACAVVCPKAAISMKEDEQGFIYPYIDSNKCIECGACEKVCHLKNPIQLKGFEKKCYFAVRKDEEELMKSTSGGLFSVIAEYVLKENGVVFGCTMERIANGFKIYHKAVTKIEDLEQIRRSKYVQSDTHICFAEVKECLQKGIKVLFCGTPCQVAGLKSYLVKEYENLLTIDLICHGTPNAKFLNSFLRFMEKKYHNIIEDVQFRKKQKNYHAESYYLDMMLDGGKHKKVFCKLTSYYGLFLSGDINRECCYQCKYACPQRVGDITLGDAWGLEKVHSEYTSEQGGAINMMYGTNSVIVNTQRAETLFKTIQKDIVCYDATFEEISKYNGQLLTPIPKSDLRDEIVHAYVSNGYKAVDKLYFSKMSKKEYIKFKFYFPLKQKIPRSWVKKIKSIKG